MKKNKTSLLLLVLAFITFSCQEELVEPKAAQTAETPAVLINSGRRPAASCTSDFYYYNKEKIQLGTVLTNRIIIGFPDGYTLDQKTAFVSKYAFLKGIEGEYNSGSADATIVLLQDGQTCEGVKNILSQLEDQTEVRYATPFYSSASGDGSMGLTNQFIVNLKPNATLKDLQLLTSKTNTTVIESLGGVTYILSADKNADGNALEMANFFATQAKVESSEPDFLYIYNSSQTAGI